MGLKKSNQLSSPVAIAVLVLLLVVGVFAVYTQSCEFENTMASLGGSYKDCSQNSHIYNLSHLLTPTLLERSVCDFGNGRVRDMGGGIEHDLSVEQTLQLIDSNGEVFSFKIEQPSFSHVTLVQFINTGPYEAKEYVSGHEHIEVSKGEETKINSPNSQCFWILSFPRPGRMD